MFKKKSSSFRGAKDLAPPTTSSSSPEPTTAVPAPATAPAPAPRPPVLKEVSKPKPTGPASIVPPGTKRVLVVGKFVVMTADVENCDAVIVQGNLDGNIKAKYVVIMKGGCMRGKVECEEADVAGSFEGVEMIAHYRLTLSGSARVGGRTTYHRLSVHDGAVLTGELQYKPALRDEPKPVADPAPVPVTAQDDDAAASTADGAADADAPAVEAGNPEPEKTTRTAAAVN
eukprot:g12487.t1